MQRKELKKGIWEPNKRRNRPCGIRKEFGERPHIKKILALERERADAEER
jgi:hypothetical protein